MKQALLIILLFISVHSLYAQVDNNFPAITENEIPGGTITRASYYGGDALWGLIDGGADIYLEYGFDKLLLQEIEWRGIKFRVEYYRMNDAKAAFGIFSVSRYKCSVNDTLTNFICITPYQVQAAVGKFYISVANDKGDNEAMDATTGLFEKILAKINEPVFEIPLLFESRGLSLYKSRMKFIKGALGIQNGFPNWSEMFEQFTKYEIYLAPVETEKGYAYISQIKFGSESDIQKFVALNKPENQNKIIKKIRPVSPTEIIYIESNLEPGNLDKLLN